MATASTSAASHPTLGRGSTLVSLLRRRVEREPGGPAYMFLVDGEDQEERLTYGELDRRARRVGRRLQESCLPGERALLLFPPGLDYVTAFFGCLYAGVVAVPAYPPMSPRQVPRLRAVLEDAQASVALVPGSSSAVEDAGDPMSGAWGQVDRLSLDELDIGSEQEWREPGIGSGDLAFLQYTSGSTRAPRGVMLTHANLLHNLALISDWFRDDAEEIAVSWLPPYHDMGLIGGILAPLHGGFPAVLMSPLHFLQRPGRWLRAISRYRGTASPAPDFAYGLCARRAAASPPVGLDLSSWRVAINGAEPVRAETLDHFAKVFGPYGFRREAFRPAYGLAEATLVVTGDPAGTPPVTRTVPTRVLQGSAEAARTRATGRTLVASGRPLGGQDLAIVDRAAPRPLPPGEVGEIWLSGPSVAQGYWGRPEETEAAFRARLAGRPGSFLRTGDLGLLDEAGRLFVTGRLKDLVILRGRNHYPQDIEWAVERSDPPALRPGCGAAFTVLVDGEEAVVVVHEVTAAGRAEPAAVLAAARRAVTEEVDADPHAVVLVEPRTIPKTSSGKIQRGACRDAFLAGELRVVAEWRGEPRPAAADEPPYQQPRDPLEELVAGVWAEVLEVPRVGVHDSFLDLGGQSLLANQVAVRIRAALPVDASAADVFAGSTVAGLAARLRTKALTTDETRLAELVDDLEADPSPSREVAT